MKTILVILLAILVPVAAHAIAGSPIGPAQGVTNATSVRILDNVASPTASQSYGTFNLVNANITVLLPTAVAGMHTCIQDSGSAHDIIVDVQATDSAVLVGSVGAGGIGVTNASGTSTGDIICLVAAAANKWYVTYKVGTWASQ